MNLAYVIYLNEASDWGGAKSKFERVSRELKASGIPFVVKRIPAEEVFSSVRTHFEKGFRRFVAAGGDGTLNLLAQALMALPDSDRSQTLLGCIGVGSSCDFLKPPDPAGWLGQCQVALDLQSAYTREVYRLDFDSGTVYFLMNSSVGLIADGCRDFASPPWWLRAVRSLAGHPASVGFYSAVKAIGHQGFPAKLISSVRQEQGTYSGITLLNHPHIAGGVQFHTRRTFQDGLMDVLALSKVSPTRMAEVAKEWSEDLPRDGGDVSFFSTRELEIEFESAETVEYDGEVLATRYAKYTVVPEALRFMGKGF